MDPATEVNGVKVISITPVHLPVPAVLSTVELMPSVHFANKLETFEDAQLETFEDAHLKVVKLLHIREGLERGNLGNARKKTFSHNLINVLACLSAAVASNNFSNHFFISFVSNKSALVLKCYQSQNSCFCQNNMFLNWYV